MSKVGGKRNFGFGKSLAWAGKNALKTEYGQGRFATQAAHAARWRRFVEFASVAGVRDARDITQELIGAYVRALASDVAAKAVSVRYAQNLVSTANTVLHALRGDKALYVSPALVGRRREARSAAPVSLDRDALNTRIRALEQNGHDRVACIAGLARELGLRFREASLLDCRAALREANKTGALTITRGTKGGRGREQARHLSGTDRARLWLERAAAHQGTASNLIPADMSFRAWRDHAYGAWSRSEAAGSAFGFHDLRAAYACERYKQLTGQPAPVVAGRRLADRAADMDARARISEELGHARVDVAVSYVGSRR